MLLDVHNVSGFSSPWESCSGGAGELLEPGLTVSSLPAPSADAITAMFPCTDQFSASWTSFPLWWKQMKSVTASDKLVAAEGWILPGTLGARLPFAMGLAP